MTTVKAKKTKNTITRKPKPAKREFKPTLHVADFYRNISTGQKHPVSEKWILQFFDDMVKEAISNDDMLTLAEYFLYRGVPTTTFWKWTQKYPDAYVSYCETKAILGARREKGALKRKYDAGFTARSMPLYSREWKKLEEWRSQLNQKDDKQPTNVTVVMAPFNDDVEPPSIKKSERPTIKESESVDIRLSPEEVAHNTRVIKKGTPLKQKVERDPDDFWLD